MMKHIFRIMVLALCVALNTACSKEDDADAFVGKYTVSDIENSTCAGMSHTNTLTGTLYIQKVSSNRVQTSGWFNTFGEVVGNSVYFESCSTVDSDMSLTNAFGVGSLNGTVLTFTTTTTGMMKLSGSWYSYTSIGQHTCIKQQ